jgi:RNA polymerase II subunit A C-terminal domain phosphatase SSU72
MAGRQLTFACVCASNVNRSMAAHQILQKNNFAVASYGTNSHIALAAPPGKANNYDFGATYSEILADIENQGTSFYLEHGIIEMIQRDQSIKEKPERFSSTFDDKRYFDVVFTYDKGVMTNVLRDFHANGNVSFHLSHVVNIETIDDTQKAKASALTTLKLARELALLPNLTEGIEALINEFVADQPIMYHIVSY